MDNTKDFEEFQRIRRVLEKERTEQFRKMLLKAGLVDE